eukprot:GFUD01037531.1.p1 GENE.GFUD01037531.1~~GFUD01037531.1.p1  ORF type:complete len:540 (-),score=94.46 GFUD01037531.1:38-1657(-)
MNLTTRTSADEDLAIMASWAAVQAQSSYLSDQWLHHHADLAHRHHTDLVLVPGDGQRVEVHSVIVLPQSTVLTSLLSNSSDQIQTILLPQVDRDTVQQMVDLLYAGECLISLNQFYKLNHLLNSLGFTQLLKTLSLNSCCIEDSHSHGKGNYLKLGSIHRYEESLGEDLDDDEVSFIDMIVNSDEKAYSISFHEDEQVLCPVKPGIEVGEQGSIISQVGSKGQGWISKLGKNGSRGETSDGRTVFDCDICTLEFRTEKRLKVHRRVYLGIECDLCGLKVSSEKKLEVHARVNCINSKFECDICGHKVSSKKRLLEHKIIQCVKFGKKSSKPTMVDAALVATTPKEEKLSHQMLRKLRSEGKQAKGKILRSKLLVMKSQYPKTLKTTSTYSMKNLNSSKNIIKLLASPVVVHSLNTIPWDAGQDKCSDDVSWVLQKSVKDMMEFQDLTEKEKAFYCLWNQFLVNHRPGICKIHLPTVLEEFIVLKGREVGEKGLYRQFVGHLVMMMREGLVEQETMVRMIKCLQECLKDASLIIKELRVC